MSFSNKKSSKKNKNLAHSHISTVKKNFALHSTYLNIKKIIELTQKYYKI